MSKVQIVWFRELNRWDIKNYLHTLKSNFPLMKLENYLTENHNKIKPFEYPNEKFDILGVNNKDGVYFNETLLGSRIKQPYYQVRAGEIFYNPYRVNVGSIGIVPKEFDLKYTSPAYVVFRTNETELLSQYLVFVLKSKWFNEHLRANTRGSVRQNLSFQALCELQIPLPPIEIQNEIVAKIEDIKNQIKALQEEEKRLKEEIEAYIYIALGLSKEKPKAREKIFIVSFKDLDRWDTTFNQNKVIRSFCEKNATPFIMQNNPCYTESAHCHSETSACHTEGFMPEVSLKSNRDTSHSLSMTNSPKYPLVPLGEIITLQYGKALPKNERKQGKYPVYGSNGIVGYHNDYLAKAPTIIVGRKGSAGEVNFVEENCYPIDTTFYVVNRKNNNIKFLFFMLENLDLKSELVGIGVPGINRSNVYKIKIPLPPLAIQEQIVQDIESIKAEMLEIDTELESLQIRQKALIEEYLATNERQRDRETERQRDRETETANLKKIESLWNELLQNQTYLNHLNDEKKAEIFSLDSSIKNLQKHKADLQENINAIFKALFAESAHCHTEQSEVSLKRHFCKCGRNPCGLHETLLKGEKSLNSNEDISAFAMQKPQYDNIESHNSPKYPLVPLGEICKFISRNYKEYYKNKSFPYIQIADVAIEGILSHSIIDFNNAPSRAKTLVKTGELIISLTRPNLGAFAIVTDEYNNYVVSSGFSVLDSGNSITNNFIKLYLQSQISIDNFNSIMSGALYPAISQNDLKQIKIPLPPLKIQQEIVAFIESKQAKIKQNQSIRIALEKSLEKTLENLLLS